jgi:hypothetical protein
LLRTSPSFWSMTRARISAILDADPIRRKRRWKLHGLSLRRMG